MNTQPIQPARIEFNAQGLPWAPAYADIYHPQAGAFLQAEHVFLAGNGLPRRWRADAAGSAPARFCILELGFGLGHNFLATWHAWRQLPDPKPALDFISLEKHPLAAGDLAQVHRESPVPELAAQLRASWPPLTPNLHGLHFEGGRLRLLLGLGDALAWLPELVARVDAFYLDGFSPAKNPELWQAKVYKALARLAAPGATLATWSAARGLREGLRSAGFDVALAQGKGGKRDITLARYAPAFTPKPAPRQRAAAALPPHDQRALIIGAGLAGCATAWALARQGWRSTVLDRQAGPAQETSGNPAGLFHGVVHGQDGVHARFNRAAALHAPRAVQEALDQAGDGEALGGVSGLLRLQPDGGGALEMQALLDRLGLPPDYVQALDARQASQRCGMDLQAAAWFYPRGGWVRPGLLCRHWLDRSQAEFHGSVDVRGIRKDPGSGDWQALDAQGAVIAQAPVLVLANAGQALALLGQPAWGVGSVRGQLSELPWPAPQAAPTMPIAGSGYLSPAVQGRVVFGATSQAGDTDASVRLADHQANLAQLERLLGRALPQDVRDSPEWRGRTGWRCTAPDRLPIVGAVPDEPAWSAMGKPTDHPRRAPRLEGLHVCMALGSRGITWAALAAEVVACGISGAAMPLEASLLDAVDPARFLARQARRRSAG